MTSRFLGLRLHVKQLHFLWWYYTLSIAVAFAIISVELFTALVKNRLCFITVVYALSEHVCPCRPQYQWPKQCPNITGLSPSSVNTTGCIGDKQLWLNMTASLSKPVKEFWE